MSRKTLAALAIIAIATPSLAQSSKEPLVLKPASAWHVDYADDRCRLAREFGAGDEQVYVFFDRFGPGEYFRLTLAGKAMKTWRNQTDAMVQFGPVEEEQQLLFLSGNLDKMPALIFANGARVAPPTPVEKKIREETKPDEQWVDFAPINENRYKAIRYLEVGKPLRNPIRLETGSMYAPLAALDKCIDNLLIHWGIDIEKHKSLTRKVTPTESPGKWIDWDDYPLEMLRVGQPAVVEFRLSVRADGKPSACHIQLTTRPKAFDDAVCKSVMSRAKFDPALDANGQVGS